jgi:hypothetical protein
LTDVTALLLCQFGYYTEGASALQVVREM